MGNFPLLLGAVLFWGGGCANTEAPPDALVELEYSQRAVSRRIKRRFDLLSAGVPLKEKWAVEQVWRNGMGYTFIGRIPSGREVGITRLVGRREGHRQADIVRGIDEVRRSQFQVESGFWIVDIFDSLGKYRTSVVGSQQMSGRRILQHLPIAEPLTEDIDRIKLTPAEEQHWRSFMPDLLLNGGYGQLFVRSVPAEDGADSLQVVGKKYSIDQLDGYILAGRGEGEQQFRHIFAQDGAYLLSVLLYQSAKIAPRDLLAAVGLGGAD